MERRSWLLETLLFSTLFPSFQTEVKRKPKNTQFDKVEQKVNLLRRGCEHHHKQWPLGFGRGTRGRRRVSIANPSCQDPILPKSPFPHNATNLFPEALRLRWWSFKKFRRHICPERKKWMVEKGEEGGCWGEEESWSEWKVEKRETFHGSRCCNVCYVLLVMAVSYV